MRDYALWIAQSAAFRAFLAGLLAGLIFLALIKPITLAFVGAVVVLALIWARFVRDPASNGQQIDSSAPHYRGLALARFCLIYAARRRL